MRSFVKWAISSLLYTIFGSGQRKKPDIVNEFLDRLEQHMKVEDAVEGLVDFILS